MVNFILSHFEDFGMLFISMFMSVYSMKFFNSTLQEKRKHEKDKLKLKHLDQHLSLLLASSTISFLFFISSLIHFVVSENFIDHPELFKHVSTLLEICIISVFGVLFFAISHIIKEDSGAYGKI